MTHWVYRSPVGVTHNDCRFHPRPRINWQRLVCQRCGEVRHAATAPQSLRHCWRSGGCGGRFVLG